MGIKKRPDGNWDVRICRRIGGRPHFWKKTKILTLGEARRIERDFLREAEDLKAKAQLGILTWAEALAEFEVYSKEVHTVSTSYTQITTLKEYTAVWNAMDIRQITRDQIRQLIEEGLTDRTIATKNNLAKYIRNVLAVQESKGRILVNPARGLNFGKVKYRKLEAMTRSEVQTLLTAVKDEGSDWYPIFRVTYELGLRSAEAYALKWSEVDFENSRVAIEYAYCFKSETTKRPKSGMRRVVPLNAALKKFLLELRAKNLDAEYVLPRVPAWKHGDAAAILRSFQRRLGIKETNFHSLRASFITHLLNKGVPITKVQAMVGHADIKTTQVYVRLAGSDLIGATDVLAMDNED